MKNFLAGLFHSLAKIIASSVLAAAILAAAGYVVLATDNPVKKELKAKATQTVKDEVNKWLLSGFQESNSP